MSLFESASLVVTPNGTKASKLYAVKPVDGSGDLSVTRATTATRVNSAGLIESVASNVPRLDYTDSTCPSILVEPQRTNITLQSEDLSTTWYTAGGLLTANATTSPSGTLTADKIKADNSNGVHVYQQTITVSAATIYTMSIFVKSGEYTYFELADTSSLKGQTFNLTSKTILSPQTAGIGAATSSNITDVGNGWLRCSITYTTSSIVGLFRVSLSNGTSTTFTGDNTSGFFVWGAQLEAGSYATSYIPTTSASVTRNADVISKTGISSLIGQTEGTIFVEEVYDANVANNGGVDDTLVSLSDGTTNNLITIFHYGGGAGSRKVLFFIRLSGATQAAIFSDPLNTGTYKIALAYKNNDVVAYINGVQIGTDTSATIPATSAITLVDPITLLAASKTVNFKNVSLWKTRLSNSELSTLTTI